MSTPTTLPPDRPSYDEDLRLARRASAGDAAARRELAGRLVDRVHTTITYLCGNDPDRDDLAQLALVEVLRSTRTFRGNSRLETWADRITVRTAQRALRKRQRSRAVVVPRAELPGEAATPDLARRELKRRLATLLQRLTPDRRVAVTLRWVYQYSVAEIATITEAKPNTVRDRLQVGKRQLRALILADAALCELLDVEAMREGDHR